MNRDQDAKRAALTSWSHPLVASQPREEAGLDPRLRDLYRAATPTQKLAVVARINATLIGLKEAELLARYAEMTPENRRERLRRWWLGAPD